ncbi:MAG: CDP-glycerol glycerophosphotransferase family protein [Oscillospiraceae bacterium]|nr:CDP-glycerol glycerophosphotransferase family protein [Oscillospiraceae bacterium]
MESFIVGLYIDPGTGSMLFTILIGVLGTCVYLLRNALVKLRFVFSGGKKEKQQGQDRLPYVIFTDSKRYWNLFEPICDEFERRGEALTYMTASPDDPALKKEYRTVKCKFIGEGNRAFARLNLLRADVLLSTTPGLDVYQWKRSKDVGCYVHILHAAGDATGYRMFGTDYYDAVLLSGDFQIGQIRELERLRGLPPKELELVGIPYLDAMKRRLESAGERPPQPTTVLLAPSWGASGILGRFGAEIIRALLATGYHVIVRPHPQSFSSEKDMLEKLMRDFPASEQLEWNRDNDNFEVLRRADLMISDFSGVIFDYALIFGKPVIYADTSFDKAPYDACWLDEEMWMFRTLPKIGRQLRKEDFGQLRRLIDEMLGDPGYRETIEAAREETWVHIGEGAARTADYLIEKRNQLIG